MMKLLFACVCALLVVEDAWCAMSEAQLKSAAKLMRNVCQPKTKVTSAQIEGMHQGTFSDEPELLSYMECILRTGQIMKDGKLNYDSLINQLKNLPPTIAEAGTNSAAKCKDAPKSGDKFVAASEFYKCFYEADPTNFFLP